MVSDYKCLQLYCSFHFRTFEIIKYKLAPQRQTVRDVFVWPSSRQSSWWFWETIALNFKYETAGNVKKGFKKTVIDMEIYRNVILRWKIERQPNACIANELDLDFSCYRNFFVQNNSFVCTSRHLQAADTRAVHKLCWAFNLNTDSTLSGPLFSG